MYTIINTLLTAIALGKTAVAAPLATTQHSLQSPAEAQIVEPNYYIGMDPRPYYLINNMTDSPLKRALERCKDGPFHVTDWSIGHRGGGTLQFPEETVESTEAGARMGAGILECDVAFTKDQGLVCRHSQCDLHTTTNLLTKPELAAKCTRPFQAANGSTPASALCCTSDITLLEYQTLCGKQDGFNASATTPEDYQAGTPNWRTELYDTCGTLMTLDSYITLVDSFPGHRNFTPELKTPPLQVPMPFEGWYTQEQYARDMLDTFIRRGIDPERVYPQSFNPGDIFQWVKEYPLFAKQAIYLDNSGSDPANYTTACNRLLSLKDQGINIIAPPFNHLVQRSLESNNTFVPTPYALAAKAAGLEIITWTFERSGPLATASKRKDYFFSTTATPQSYDGEIFEILDVLGREIGVKGMFSDWSSTVTFYANCFGL